MTGETCFICKAEITKDSRTVGEKAINTIISASVKRKDNHHKHLKNLKTLVVHGTCYRNYVTERVIEQSLRQKKKRRSESYESEKASKSEFNFEKYCFFCEEDASDEYVENFHTKQNFKKVKYVKNNDILQKNF